MIRYQSIGDLNLKICPHCRNIMREQENYCIFCGTRHRRFGMVSKSNRANTALSPFTLAGTAQRIMTLFSLIFTTVVFAVVLFAPPTGRQLVAAGLIAPKLPAASDAFSDISGDYPITLSLSEVTSDVPETQSAAEDIMGEAFPGVLTLSVDNGGVGTLSIQQLFFTQEVISVSPFTDTEGVTSQTTLYGYLQRNGMKLSVVCVCQSGGVSGFIWLDQKSTHIEFLFGG
jgi:hypothetical protein